MNFFGKKAFLDKEDVFGKVKNTYDVEIEKGFLIFETDQQRTYIAKTPTNRILLINDNLGDIILAVNEAIEDFDFNVENNISYFNNNFWKFYIEGFRDGFYVNRKIYSPKMFQKKIEELVH